MKIKGSYLYFALLACACIAACAYAVTDLFADLPSLVFLALLLAFACIGLWLKDALIGARYLFYCICVQLLFAAAIFAALKIPRHGAVCAQYGDRHRRHRHTARHRSARAAGVFLRPAVLLPNGRQKNPAKAHTRRNFNPKRRYYASLRLLFRATILRRDLKFQRFSVTAREI